MNSLKAVILNVVNFGNLNLVKVSSGGIILNLVMLQLLEETVAGKEAALLFKETEVILLKNEIQVIGMENIIPVTVTDVKAGLLFSEISLDSVCGEFRALITMNPDAAPDSWIGQKIIACIKPNEIALEW